MQKTDWRFRAHRFAAQAWLLDQPAWVVSLCFHLMLLVAFALFLLPGQVPSSLTLQLAPWVGPETDLQDFSLAEWEEVPEPEFGPEPSVDSAIGLLEDIESIDRPVFDLIAKYQSPNVTKSSMEATEESSFEDRADETDDVPRKGHPGGIPLRLGLRGHAEQLGATPESEAAVERALHWLAVHQGYDGSWTFDLHQGRCKGACSNSGNGGIAKRGATSMALLAFLGAGNTSIEGKYADEVKRGLKFLVSQQGNDGSFWEPLGTMYSHGLAALVLSEVVAMESSSAEASSYSSSQAAKHPRPKRSGWDRAAQYAVDFIVRSQHEEGGWRYSPQQRGDTSVVGWQAMALQSGSQAKLQVPQPTLQGIQRFLNSVQSDSYGATYGYQQTQSRPPIAGPATTAVGLLCRMYGGWDRTHPAMIQGVDQLSQTGPSSNNIYYNYYATQVMHHFQGPLWENWNSTLRDFLVDSQVREGHESGSWYFSGDHGSTVGGRLYITTLATMTLEVYYRHLPIYPVAR